MKTWTLVTIAVLAVLVVIAGIGGYLLGSAAGEARANSVRSEFLAQRFGGQLPGAMAGQTGVGQLAGRAGAVAGRAAASGTVKSVEGSSLVVTTRDGQVKVRLSADVAVTKTEPATVQDIQAGMRIVVMGETAPSGEVTARSVQLAPAGD